MITLKWHGDLPPLDLDHVTLEVLLDIKKSLGKLEKPSDLIFHTVFLGKDCNGPYVFVWGEPMDDLHFHCEYHTEMNWVTLGKD